MSSMSPDSSMSSMSPDSSMSVSAGTTSWICASPATSEDTDTPIKVSVSSAVTSK